MKKYPPFVRHKRAKGRDYYYFDTGQRNERGRPILTRLPQPDDPSFGTALSRATAARTRREVTPAILTYSALADMFEKSREFDRLAAATKKSYRLYLDRGREICGIAPAAELSANDVRILRDRMADTPGAANQFIRVTGALYKWGRRRGYVQNEPTKDVDYLDQGEHEPWPEWLVERALSDPAVRLPVSLLYYTAQRIGDVVKMQWTDIRGGKIEVRQQKTGKALDIPIHADLRALLDETPKAGFHLLAKDNGAGWTASGLRTNLQRWAEAQGVKIVPHGLRKNAVNALLEAGCSAAETAAISGQTLQVIEHYAKRRDTGVLASAAIHRWENKRGR